MAIVCRSPASLPQTNVTFTAASELPARTIRPVYDFPLRTARPDCWNPRGSFLSALTSGVWSPVYGLMVSIATNSSPPIGIQYRGGDRCLHAGTGGGGGGFDVIGR